jgi:hypothetical protein
LGVVRVLCCIVITGFVGAWWGYAMFCMCDQLKVFIDLEIAEGEFLGFVMIVRL